MMKKSGLIIGAVLASVVLAGCSGSEDGGPDPTVDPEAALQVSAQQWVDGFYGGNASNAYVLFTSDCQERFAEAEFTAISDFVKVDPPTIENVMVEVNGDTGIVRYTENGDTSGPMPWVLQDGQWRTSDCVLRE